MSTTSSSLQESLKKQCWAYFYSYHCDRLEDLKMHLENEVSNIELYKMDTVRHIYINIYQIYFDTSSNFQGWAICPVRPSFNIFQLQEFRHVKGRNE